jgi:hypothetical protein
VSVSNDHLESILVSLLAANSYPIQRAWDLLPGLKDAGLTDPTIVLAGSVGEIITRLENAGYKRGNMTIIFADRVKNLMRSVTEGELDALDVMVAQGDREAAVGLLCKIKGIGARSAELAWSMLRG